eukprot:6177040-Pleurochrysis_carterae.AAC.1
MGGKRGQACGRWHDGKHYNAAAPCPMGGARAVRVEEAGSAKYLSHERKGQSPVYTRPRRGAGRHEREREERVIVQLFEAGGDGAAPMFMPAGELLAASDAALAG